MGATKKICGISSLLVFRQSLFKKNVQITFCTQGKNLFFFRKNDNFASNIRNYQFYPYQILKTDIRLLLRSPMTTHL